MSNDPNFNSIDDIFPSDDPIQESGAHLSGANLSEMHARAPRTRDYNLPSRHPADEMGVRQMSRRKTVSYPEESISDDDSEELEGLEETEGSETSDNEDINNVCAPSKKEKFLSNSLYKEQNNSLFEWAKNIAFVISFIFLVTFLFTSQQVKKIIDKALKIDSEKETCYGTAHKLIIAGCTSSATLVFAFLLRYFSNYSQQKH